jgi:hypothetical protein
VHGRRLYIRGLVKTANSVRRDLAHPLSAERKAELRSFVTDTLEQVEQILRRNGNSVASLPAPTRRAYEFLSSLDFDAITAVSASDAARPARGNTSLVGIQSFWERILAGLGQPISPERADDLYQSIRSADENIERYMDIEDLSTDDLTAQSRAARGWLAFFSNRQSFDTYLAAVQRAQPALDAALGKTGRFRPPALVEFRPTSGLYRLRGYSDGTRVVLPTAMICFTASEFNALARTVIGEGDRRAVMEATQCDQYQTIQAELQSLSGVQQRTAGVHHDLAESFDRVVRQYFDPPLSRPRLTWSTVFTSRKFGHYDPIRDTVMLSCTLDRPNVPEYVLDFVMYHELLHKKLGADWRNGCRAVHTPEFRRQERRFAEYDKAQAALTRLATHRL